MPQRSTSEPSRSVSPGDSAWERTGCSTFRVVVTGIPETPSVQDDFRQQVESVGLTVEFVPAVRYPEVSADVPAVR